MKKLRLFLLLLMVAMLPLAMQAQQSLPYSYGFEDNDLSTNGWDSQNLSTANASEFGIYNAGSSTAHDGNYVFRFSSFSRDYTSYDQYLISPLLDAPTGVVFQFWYRAYSTNGTENFKVGYSTTDADVASFIFGDEISTNSLTWAHSEEYTFPAGTKYIAIYYYSDYQYRLYLDDFTFAAPSACPKPTGLAKSNVTTTSATLTWDAGTASGWTLEYSTSADFSDAVSETVTGTPSINITPLTAQTLYYVRVKADCGTDGESEWCNAINFTTPCEAFNVTAETPYQENFDATTFPPECWGNVHSAGSSTTVWSRSTSPTHNSSAGAAYLSYQSTGNRINLITRPVNIPEANAYQVSLWMYRSYAATTSYLNEGLKVWVNTSPDTVGGTEINFIHRAYNLTPAEEATGWYQYEAIIPSSGDMYVIFEAIFENGYAIYIDDISIEKAPSCLKPTDVAVVEGSVTAHGASISWTDNTANPLGWILLVNDQEVEANSNPFPLTGLTPDMPYTVQVKAVCTETDTSEWSNTAAIFRTGCAPITVTEETDWKDDFENSSSSTFPTCWKLVESYSSYPYVYSSIYSAHNGEQLMYMCVYGSSNKNLMATPEFTNDLNTLQVRFWARYSSTNPTFIVGTLDGETFEPMDTITLTSSYKEYTVMLNHYTGNGNRIAFRALPSGTSSYSSYYVYLDDITVELLPNCLKPLNPTVDQTSITATGATISWTDDTADPLSWILLVNDQEVEANTNPFPLTTLTPETNYTVKVKAVCTETDTSDWSDASVSFTTPPTCPAPTDLTIVEGSETSDGATLSWTAGGEESAWIINYNGTDTLVSANPFTFHNLTPATHYTVKVMAVCSSTDSSAWSSSKSFNTECVTVVVTEENPFIEKFDNNGLCWTPNDYVTGTTNWKIITSISSSEGGSNFTSLYDGPCADFYSSSSAQKTRAISPVLDITALENPRLTFQMANPAWGNDINKLKIYFRTAEDEEWIEIDSIGDAHEEWTPMTYPLTVSSATFQIAFEGSNNTGNNYGRAIFLDDITVEQTPACLKPSNLTLDTVTTTYFTVSWTDNNEETPASWTVAYSIDGGETFTEIANIDHDSAVVCDFPTPMGDKNVIAKVRADCSAESPSAYSDVINFVTPPTCLIPDSLTYSGVTYNTVVLDWIPRGEEEAWILTLSTSNYTVDLPVTEHPLTIDTLTEQTPYVARIRAYCGEDDTSRYCTMTARFVTGCAPLQTENYSEGFSGYTASSYPSTFSTMPDCWNYIYTGSYLGYRPHVYNGSSYSPVAYNNCLIMTAGDASYYGNDAYAVMPQFESLSGKQIVFSTAMESADYGTLTVGYLTYPDASTFTPLEVIPNNYYYTTPRAVMHEVVVNSVPAGARIAFKWAATTSYYYCCIDSIKITDMPTCAKPTALEVSNITTTGATLNWTDNNLSTPQTWAIRLNDMDTTVTADDSFTFDNLTEATHYTVKMRANCNETDTSDWSDEITFFTLCNPISAEDYSEGFSGYTASSYTSTFSTMPDCWDYIYTGSSLGYRPHVYNGSSYSPFASDNCLIMVAGDSASYGNDAYAIMPQFEDLSGKQIVFYTAMESADDGTLTLGYLSDATDASTFTPLEVIPNNYYYTTPRAVMHEVVVNSVPADARIAFRWHHESSYYYCCIDSIKITDMPNCVKPVAVEVANVTAHSAEISWRDDNLTDAASFTIWYNGADTTVTDNPFTFDNLTASTTYTVKVRSNCNETDTSDWSTEITFATPCEPTPAENYSEDFSGYTASSSATSTYTISSWVMPDCWDYLYDGYDAGEPHVYNGYSAVTSGNNCLVMTAGSDYEYYEDYGTTNYAIMPEFNSLTGKQINFAYKTGSSGTLTFGYITDATDADSFVEMETLPSATTAANYEINVENVPAGARLAFAWTCNSYYSSYSCCIDDITLTNLPNCRKATDLIFSAITTTSATIDWTDNNVEAPQTWTISLNGTDTTVTGKPFTIDNLTANTAYTVMVRANCNETDTSDWSREATFRTDCDATPVSGYSEDFSGYTASSSAVSSYASTISTWVMPDCWKYLYEGEDAGAEPHVYNGYSAVTSYNNCLVITSGSDYDYYDYESYDYGTTNYAIMPEFDTLTGKQINFAYKTDSYGTLTFGYVTDATDADSFVEIETLPSASTATDYEINVDNVPAGARLAFQWTYTSSYYSYYYSCYIDDITITNLPTCRKPVDVIVVENSITTTSATINWTETNTTTPQSWTIRYNGTDTTVTDKPATLYNLNPSTRYTIQVKANCDSIDESAWSNEVTFRTECGDVTIDENHPFEDGFEDYNEYTFPDCWTLDVAYEGYSYEYPYVYESSYSSHTGDKYLYMYFSGANEKNIISTPAFTNAMSTLQVSFYAEYSTNALFEVGVMNGTTFEPVDTIALTSNYVKYTVRFNHYMGNGSRVAFKTSPLNANSTSGYIYLDDVTVELIPSCIAPEDVEITAISTTGATIDWTDPNETAPQSWTVRLNGVDTTVTEHPFTFDNLTHTTFYTVQVKANCDLLDESEWSVEETFSTDCEVIPALGYSEDFSGYNATSYYYSTSSVMPTCWDMIYNGTTSGYPPYVYNGTYTINGNSLFINAGGSSYGYVNYVIMPELAELNGNTMMFSYQWENTSYGSLVVGYVTNATNASTFQALRNVTASSTVTTDTLSFTDIPDGARIAFQWTGTNVSSLYYGVAIDDINITATPEPCAAPDSVTIDSNYVVRWTGDAPGGYNVIVVVGNDTVVRAYSSTHLYTITSGLNDGDHAIVYVQSICAADDLSEWSTGVPFVYGTDTIGVDNYRISANIFPNPTTGNVTVESNAIGADLNVYDMFGKLMIATKVTDVRTELNLSGFAPGVYMVRIANSTAVTTVKVVKK